ncbi:MAG: hypothetical protein Kow00105_05480 [Phycisphaeraceae bacterium]
MTEAPPNTSSRAEYRLDCLEVWGGSHHIDNTVRVTGVDVWAWSRPADRVAGGDVYLVSMCACAEVSRFLVADVTGHDAGAAQVALRLRRLMRRHINKPDQTRLIRSLNRDFDGMARYGRFATAVLATFFPPTRHLIVCNAGHPRPLWYRAAEKQWTALSAENQMRHKGANNLPLGILDDVPYEQYAIQMARGDLVLLYTDGVTEARTATGDLLGESGLINIISRINTSDPSRVLMALQTRLGMITNGMLSDDVTMLLLHANDETMPRQSFTDKVRVAAKMLGLQLGRRAPRVSRPKVLSRP